MNCLCISFILFCSVNFVLSTEKNLNDDSNDFNDGLSNFIDDDQDYNNLKMVISGNFTQLIERFFKIANEFLDNFQTINEGGLVYTLVRLTQFINTMNQFVDPYLWQNNLKQFKIDLPNFRLPFKLKSQNIKHEQNFELPDFF